MLLLLLLVMKMLLLLLLLLMVKDNLRACIGAAASGEGGRFERCAAAGLMISADPKGVHRFEARFVGIAIVQDGGVG